MVTIGVTGGIGSGKTTVCKVWERLGAVVVYADKLARDLMVSEPSLVVAVRREFGDQAYLPDGRLNREFLAREAFGRERSEELNHLVHPVVAGRVKELMFRARESGAEMFVEEAALLLVSGRPPGFDYIVLVTADGKSRIDRVRQRDGVSSREVQARMRRQQPLEELAALSDIVIENNSTKEALEKRAEELYQRLISEKPGRQERID